MKVTSVSEECCIIIKSYQKNVPGKAEMIPLWNAGSEQSQ
jgi:hypothetical protein